MTEVATESTNKQQDDLLNYYALRLTIQHVDWPKLQEVVNKHSRNYCAGLHSADDEVPHEHFHFVFLDLSDRKKVEAMRIALRRVFEKAGNAFYAGKYMDNHVYKALQYMKHDACITWKHRGLGWQKYIDESPEWVQKEDLKKAPEKRKREADPVLSFSNILWRALKHRQDHQIKSTELGVTLEHMTRTTNWIPSPQIMKFGLDPLHHKLFSFRAGGRTGPTPNWWECRHTD